VIGIDLVDLSAAALESNPFRKGYLNKVFSAEEQTLILDYVEPSKMVWVLWSMKEAVYKICSNELSLRIFAPIDIQCSITNLSKDSAEGKVCAYNEFYFTQTMTFSNYIYSLAAKQKTKLQDIEVRLYPYPATFDYHATTPQSISHHGGHLALAYYSYPLPIDC
jgi:phosphopantetheinyl transferase (holo-ACP synthase)